MYTDNFIGDIYIFPSGHHWQGSIAQVVKKLDYESLEIKFLNKNMQRFISNSNRVFTRGHACINISAVERYIKISNCTIQDVIRALISLN